MQNWEVRNNELVISDEERDQRIKALLKEYVQLSDKLGHATPVQVLDVIQLRYADWFRAVSPQVSLKFIDELDKTIIKMDIDPYWEVSFDYQEKVSDVFNFFLKAMKKLKPEDKKDRIVVNDVLNTAFGKAYGIATDNRSITSALRGNKQLNKVAKRLFKRLDKMGYAF